LPVDVLLGTRRTLLAAKQFAIFFCIRPHTVRSNLHLAIFTFQLFCRASRWGGPLWRETGH